MHPPKPHGGGLALRGGEARPRSGAGTDTAPKSESSRYVYTRRTKRRRRTSNPSTSCLTTESKHASSWADVSSDLVGPFLFGSLSDQESTSCPTTACKHVSSWSDLPPDLLGQVLLRLHHLVDRVRVSAVCKPWRSGARLQPLPPPMPWVTHGADGYLDIANKARRRLKLTTPFGRTCRGSVDRLLFVKNAGGGCFLANPFSGKVIPVPDLAFFLEEQTREAKFSLSYNVSVRVDKVVVHWPSSSWQEPVVAAMIRSSENDKKTTIFVCRAGAGTAAVVKESNTYSTMSVHLRLVCDIAFFRGNLYAVLEHGELVVVEFGEGSSGKPSISNVTYVIQNSPNLCFLGNLNYEDDRLAARSEVFLVESGDQLLMVVLRWLYAIFHRATPRLSVYEADFSVSQCQWMPIQNLHGCALFVGRYGSKSVPGGDGNSGAQEDCIYFIPNDEDAGIYNMRDGRIRPLVIPRGPPVRGRRGLWTPTWVFP
ncbi:hypothetical protein EJB05_35217, partial [Eragrostis curvula]